MPKVAIIILTFNALEKATKPCLKSIYSCKNKNDFFITVVDNFSTDGTREYLLDLSRQYNNLKVILNNKNLGYAAGNNIGIKSIDADYYILLNNDTIVTDFWIDKFVSFFEKNPDIGIIGPVTNNVGNEQIIFIESTKQNDILAEGLVWERNSLGSFFYTEMLGFFCVSIKKDVFNKIGFLEESYGLGFFEDDDFCLRALRSNIKMACLEDVFIYHKGSASFNEMNKEEYRNLFLRNIKIFETKFNTKYKPKWTNSPFIDLLIYYIDDTNLLPSLPINKIKNKLRVMKNIDYAQLTIENLNLFNKTKSFEGKIKEFNKQLDETTKQLDETTKQLDETTKQLDETTKQLDETTKQLDETTKQLDETTKQLDETTKQLDNSNNQFKLIITSDLWILANLLNKFANNMRIVPLIKFILMLKRKNVLKQVYIKLAMIKLSLNEYAKKPIKILGFRGTNKINIPNFTGGIKNKVSIILPVYNQACYLEDAIESALNQTYQNLELIVINDGSNDGIEKIFDKYINNPRVILLTQENLKLPSALNNGFKYATGEFYTWTSADNIMHLNQIEKLVKYLRNNPDIGMVFSDYQAIDNYGKPLKDPLFRPQNQDPKDNSLIRLPNRVSEQNLHDSGDNFIGPSFMYRRDIAWAIGEYSIDTFGGEDYDYWLRINNLYDIGHLTEILYKYRVHENTLNAKAKELNLFDNIKRLLKRDKKRREFLKEDFEYIQEENFLNIPRTPSENKIYLYKYSTIINDRHTYNKIYNKNSLIVCFIDTDPQSIDYKILANYDLIITENKDQLLYIYPKFKYKVFCFNALQYLDIFYKITKNRLFDKINLQSQNKFDPLVYVNRKIRIALQVDNMDKGGLEQVVLNLVRHLDKNKFDLVLIICSAKPGYFGEMLLNQGYNIQCIEKNESYLEDIIKKEHIEIANLHYSIFGYKIYKKFSIPMIYTIHNSYTWLHSKQIEERKIAFEYIEIFIAVSNQVKIYFHSKFKIPYNKIITIPNGLDPSEMDSKTTSKIDYGFKNTDFIITNIASFNGLKAHNLMLSALSKNIKKYPQIKLIFVGNILDENYYNNIVNRIKSEGLENNTLILNYLPREEISNLLHSSNCFLLPSIQEGWSNAVMEAMYCGLPLILSDTGSARDIIKDNNIGIIIPNPYTDINNLSLQELLKLSYDVFPKNTQNLINAINDIYENYSIWKEKAQKGIEISNTEYSINIMIEKYEKVIYETKYIYHKRDDVRLFEGR